MVIVAHAVIHAPTRTDASEDGVRVIARCKAQMDDAHHYAPRLRRPLKHRAPARRRAKRRVARDSRRRGPAPNDGRPVVITKRNRSRGMLSYRIAADRSAAGPLLRTMRVRLRDWPAATVWAAGSSGSGGVGVLNSVLRLTGRQRAQKQRDTEDGMEAGRKDGSAEAKHGATHTTSRPPA